MTKISTKYFLITQNDQVQIDNLLEDEMEFDQLSKELESFVFNSEPSDEVIRRILSFVSNEM